MDLRFIPQPRHLDMSAGTFNVDSISQMRLSGNAEPLANIITREWREETTRELAMEQIDSEVFSFSLGKAEPVPPADKHSEAYSLHITPQGLAAQANTYQGLVYAWQTLKQILRHNTEEMPCLHINDWPDLRWRIYHVDLKATRRRLSNLYDILPQLSEFKINAVLVEYEDYIKFQRHGELAIPEALTKDEITSWVAAAADYGIAVIPLVQTLAHWQYILGRPDFAHLQEMPGDTTTACPSQPETWTLATDFLDEMMEMHPDAPFIHVGLDETFQLGVCRACKARLNGREPKYLFTEWANKICSYVLEHGSEPMMWGDMIESLDPEMGKELNQETTYVDWGYMHSAPAHPYVNVHGKQYLSNQWLRRPEGEISGIPRLNLASIPNSYEDLPDQERRALKPYLDNPEYPKKLKADIRLAWLKHLGLKTGFVTGIRVSYHGCVAPLFIHGQLNTLTGTQACKDLGAAVVIGSSWARGHSFARINAHPELDWYGIATLGDSGWGPLRPDQLRDFDVRFAFQFFGLDDGQIGDLYYLFERTGPRAHDVMDNYLEYIKARCAEMLPQVKRNHIRLALFAAIVDMAMLRIKAQVTLLEMEYFYANKQCMPPAFRQRMLDDIAAVNSEMEQRMGQLEKLYRQTLIDPDAKELAAAQLRFWQDNMMAMKNFFFDTPD